MLHQRLPRGLKLFRQLSFPHKYGVLDKLYGSILSSIGVAIMEVPGGIKWKLDLRNPTHRWCLYGSIFDPTTAKWIENSLKGGGVIIDSGANIGQALILFAGYPGVSVHAFEPLPECKVWINESLGLNSNLEVTLVPCGLYSENCQLEIQVAGNDEIHGAHATLRMDWYKEKHFDRLLIDLITLDEYAESEGIDEIRFWKLDVEGAELEALKGAESLLKEQKIHSLLVETNAADSGVMEYMKEFGYLPFLLNNKSEPVQWGVHDETAADYIFLPST